MDWSCSAAGEVSSLGSFFRGRGAGVEAALPPLYASRLIRPEPAAPASGAETTRSASSCAAASSSSNRTASAAVGLVRRPTIAGSGSDLVAVRADLERILAVGLLPPLAAADPAAILTVAPVDAAELLPWLCNRGGLVPSGAAASCVLGRRGLSE